MDERSVIERREEMEDFIESLDGYTTVIPDEITEHYVKRTGFNTPDVRMYDTTLNSTFIAAQKFLSDVVYDASNYFTKNNPVKGGKEKKRILQTEDLQNALRDYGINVRKPDYFADNIHSGVTKKK